MKLKINIGIPVLFVSASLFLTPILHGAKSELKPFIAPINAIPSESEISAFIKELGNKDDSSRSLAVASLRKIGEPAIPRLIEALTDINSSVRKGAAEVLGNIGNVKPEVVPALVSS